MKPKLRKQSKTVAEIVESLIEKLDKPPKLRVIPLIQTKDEKLKAEVLSKILEHEWGTIEARIKEEIYQPMLRCFLYGQHKWKGYGQKDRHICTRCGWKTWAGNDPIYSGFAEVSWDKKK